MAEIIGRVCIRKSDSKLIEFQSGRDKENKKILFDNALKAGFLIGTIEENEVTKSQYDALLLLQPVVSKTQQKIKLKNLTTSVIAEYEVI